MEDPFFSIELGRAGERSSPMGEEAAHILVSNRGAT